jgi:hypothetical protein
MTSTLCLAVCLLACGSSSFFSSDKESGKEEPKEEHVQAMAAKLKEAPGAKDAQRVEHPGTDVIVQGLGQGCARASDCPSSLFCATATRTCSAPPSKLGADCSAVGSTPGAAPTKGACAATDPEEDDEPLSCVPRPDGHFACGQLVDEGGECGLDEHKNPLACEGSLFCSTAGRNANGICSPPAATGDTCTRFNVLDPAHPLPGACSAPGSTHVACAQDNESGLSFTCAPATATAGHACGPSTRPVVACAGGACVRSGAGWECSGSLVH